MSVAHYVERRWLRIAPDRVNVEDCLPKRSRACVDSWVSSDRIDHMTDKPDINQIVESMQPMLIVAEAVAGYHKKLIDAGVTPESAARMTEELHTTLMATLVAQDAAKRR